MRFIDVEGAVTRITYRPGRRGLGAGAARSNLSLALLLVTPSSTRVRQQRPQSQERPGPYQGWGICGMSQTEVPSHLSSRDSCPEAQCPEVQCDLFARRPSWSSKQPVSAVGPGPRRLFPGVGSGEQSAASTPCPFPRRSRMPRPASPAMGGGVQAPAEFAAEALI
jgi:hypothetical protein